MKTWLALAILGACLGLSSVPAGAAQRSDWPSLDADAAHSNSNPLEKTLSAKNVLKLTVKWVAPVPNLSYPVVADGKVFVPVLTGAKVQVRALNALTGKQVHVYPHDAMGGMFYKNGTLYTAGRWFQAFDAATDKRQSQVVPPEGPKSGMFLDPTADSRVVLVGHAATAHGVTSSLFTLDPTSGAILHRLPSSTALGTIASNNRILTVTSAGAAFYDEGSGRSVAKGASLFGSWFAGTTLSYTVAALTTKAASVLAYDSSGHRLWSRTVGPAYAVQDWPHAVTDTAVFVERARPTIGVEALDPMSGAVLWNRTMANVQRLAEANGVLYVLTYALGQPVRIVALKADTGTVIGVISLSTGYYAFPEYNNLMVANGMVFIRAVGPGNVQELVALGLPG